MIFGWFFGRLVGIGDRGGGVRKMESGKKKELDENLGREMKNNCCLNKKKVSYKIIFYCVVCGFLLGIFIYNSG